MVDGPVVQNDNRIQKDNRVRRKGGRCGFWLDRTSRPERACLLNSPLAGTRQLYWREKEPHNGLPQYEGMLTAELMVWLYAFMYQKGSRGKA